MKIAFLADLHLGHLYGNPKEKERAEDSFKVAEEAIEIANREADLIVIAGDLFDKRSPGLSVLIRAVDVLKKAEVPIFAIHGNHDVRAGDKENVLAFLDRTGVIKYIHNKKVVFEKNGEKINIYGAGWIPYDLAPSFFLSMAPKGSGKDIFVAHQSLEGFYPYDDETPLPIGALPEGYAIYVFGHMHWFAEKEVEGKHILLPGSTIVTQLRDKELLSKKYVSIYDTETGTVEKIPLQSVRPGYVVEIDVTGKEVKEVIEEIHKKVAKLCGDPAPIVKVVVKGVASGFFNFESIQKHYEGKAIVKIFDKTYQSVVEEILELRKKYEKDTEMFSEKYALKLLKDMAAEAGLNYDAFDELFEALKEGNVEKAMDLVLKEGKEQKEKEKGILKWV